MVSAVLVDTPAASRGRGLGPNGRKYRSRRAPTMKACRTIPPHRATQLLKKETAIFPVSDWEPVLGTGPSSHVLLLEPHRHG